MASLDFEHEKNTFREFYSTHQKRMLDAESLFRNILTSILSNSERVEGAMVTGRIKDREECISKFSRKYRNYLEEAKLEYNIKDHITDLIGLRVVCIYEDQVEQIGEILKHNFEILEITDKARALEETEGDFGYKGLHLDLRLKADRLALPEYEPYSDFRFEVQIRTLVQDAWSVMDHKIKYKKSIPVDLKRRINALAAQFELIDHEFLNLRKKSEELSQNASVTTQEPDVDAPMDVFSFLAIARKAFDGYEFITTFADGFVEDILRCQNDFTALDFDRVLSTQRKTVERYKLECGRKMNPYTVIRHALYLHDKSAFHRVLFDMQRDALELWSHQQ